MAAQIYAAPEEIKEPKLDFTDIPKYHKEEEEYLEKLKEYCLENNDDPYTGEIIKLPHADNYASYMVASIRPLELIHIPLWDGYNSRFAELLTTKKVKEMIERDRRLAKIFPPR